MFNRRVVIFLIIGINTVLIDYFIYIGLINLIFEKNFAKALGFISGTIFSYFANKIWTFGDIQSQSKSYIYFTILYGFTLSINVLVNISCIKLLASLGEISFTISFLIATTCSATINFIGMKKFVFKDKNS